MTTRLYSVVRLVAGGLPAALLAACFALGGDPGISLYLWNRTDQAYVVRVGDDLSDECYVAAPQSVGKFYGDTGHITSGTRPLRLYTADGRSVTSLTPTEQAVMYVLTPVDEVSAVTVRYERAVPRMDIPEIPELDGQQPPEFFPMTDEVCVTD